MKFVVILCVFAFTIAIGRAQFIPIRECPPGEHSVLYCPRMAEPSCDIPTLHELAVPGACDTPDCFCNRPNVRNTRTNKCVPLTEC